MKPTADTSIEGLFDKSLTSLHAALDELNASMKRLISAKASKSKFDTDSRIAFIAGKIGGIMEVARKMEGQRRKTMDQLTPRLVMSWLRQLPADDRANFLAEATTLDQKRSGLA